MIANELAAKKNVYEHKATISLFSWKIRVYGKKTGNPVILNNVDLACEQIDRQIRSVDFAEMYAITKGLR